MPKRNLFLTKTIISACVTLAALFASVSPNIEGLLARNKTESEKLDIRDWMTIAVGIAGFIGVNVGRYEAGGVYTPKFLPGEDPPEKLQ